MDSTDYSRPQLPDRSDPGYVDALIEACIIVYGWFGADAPALNFMGVDEKLRPAVLENQHYKRMTRQVQAQTYLDEIVDVNAMIKALRADTPKEPKYDPRHPDKDGMDSYNKDIKENISLRLKLSDIRRELLSINKAESDEQADALNIYFIPVTAEEFAVLGNVEIHEGKEIADMNDKDNKDKIIASFGSAEDVSPPKFIIDSDGSLVDIDD